MCDVTTRRYYRHLCHCSLPVRAQDQADLAVSGNGRHVWTVLSYNDKPVHHESLITRGAFVFDISGDTATLSSNVVAWKEKLPGFPRPDDSSPRITNIVELAMPPH